MAIPAGSYTFGPDNARLAVHTERTGAAAKAGHNLHFDVTSWTATVTVADDPSASAIEVTADGGSLKVVEGVGGMQSLDDGNKADIEQTVDDEILRRQPVTFRSSKVTANGGGWHAEGDLTLLGATRPFAFEVQLGDDGSIGAEAVLKQTLWGLKPYSTLFGALKVVDEVTIRVDAGLSA
jgi:polyisoprenoid-binding protein YceI